MEINNQFDFESVFKEQDILLESIFEEHDNLKESAKLESMSNEQSKSMDSTQFDFSCNDYDKLRESAEAELNRNPDVINIFVQNYLNQNIGVGIVNMRTRSFQKCAFKCSYEGCSKTFKTHKEQSNHIDRHSEEPNCFCKFPNCKKGYTTKASLDLHIQRNHREKKHKCDFCSKRYSVKGDLNQHVKRAHNDSNYRGRRNLLARRISPNQIFQ